MALFEWTDDFITGIEMIDKDHQLLVSLINQLHAAIEADQDRDIIASVLTVLTEYTCTHFAREEKLLEKSDYPDLAEHREKHRNLSSQAIEIYRRYSENEASDISTETLVFLKEWLTKHILGSDMAYRPYVKDLFLTREEEMEAMSLDGKDVPSDLQWA